MGNAGVRFTDVLAEREREKLARDLRSVGATATSWGVAANRSYATLALASHANPDDVRALLSSASVSSPPLVVLRVVPQHTRDIARLHSALAGAGGFAGIAFAATESDALVIEVDVHATALSTILALIDVEIGADGRRIEPIVPLDDATLAALAGAILREPDLCDATRLIETHLEPILARGNA